MALDKNLFSKVMTIFGFFMVVVFLAMGIALIQNYYPVYNYFDPNMKTVLGFFFIMYGVFRLARIIQQIRKQKQKTFYDEK